MVPDTADPAADVTRPFLLLQDAPSDGDLGAGWGFRFNLPLWITAVEGTLGNDRVTADVDASFDDLLDNLDLVLVLDFEFKKGPWSILFSGMYFEFGADGELPGGADTDVEAEMGLIDLAVAYQFIEIPLGSQLDRPPRLALDAMAGLRWTYLSAQFDINSGPLAGRGLDGDADWFDPYVGLRGTLFLSEQFDIAAYGTIGGFGVGSDFAWSFQVLGEYWFSRKFAVFAGYRLLDYDYDDEFIWDITMHGPVIGIAMYW